MINELHQLSLALESASIPVENWHREYKPLPNITAKAPCIRILLKNGHVERLESIPAEMGKLLRRYGDNQGYFPSMNLAPLFRVEQEEIASAITKLKKSSGAEMDIPLIRNWCTVSNWSAKFNDKYVVSMVKRAAKLSELLKGDYEYKPLTRLIEASRSFVEPSLLHAQLTEKAFEMLAQKQETALALTILFFLVKPDKKDDYGSLCVMLDEDSLIDDGLQTVGKRFTQGLNKALLRATQVQAMQTKDLPVDAFGLPFDNPQEPMPSVKLAGGFDAILRTMSKNEPSQHRYGYIESDTYPLSSAKRLKLQSAFSWLGSEEMRDKTWTRTDDGEITFFYPSSLPGTKPELASKFKRLQRDNKQALFEAEAAGFREFLTKTKRADPEHYPRNIHIFTLRKLDKGRNKITFTKCTTPDEIVLRSDDWQNAAANLPLSPGLLGKVWVPFPLEIAGMMNHAWKGDVSEGPMIATDNFKPVSSYHGMELFFGLPRASLLADVHFVIRNTEVLFVESNQLINSEKAPKKEQNKKWHLRDAAVLLGMLLYWLQIRKDDYMNEFPFLLGQLLKASDALHEVYCDQVRGGDKPIQFAGSGLMNTASETPLQAMAQLCKRMQPYIAWARTNRFAELPRKGQNGKEYTLSVGYYLSVYERIANKLHAIELKKTRFTDEDKAQLFIGFLASFPKTEGQTSLAPEDTYEESINENGGINE